MVVVVVVAEDASERGYTCPGFFVCSPQLASLPLATYQSVRQERRRGEARAGQGGERQVREGRQ